MTTLDKFRPKTAPQRKKVVWEEMSLDVLGYGRVLAFDPSLSATGFVALSNDEFDGLHVHSALTLAGAVPEGFTGWERDMRVAEDLEAQIERLASRYSKHEWEVATETPPVGGGKIRSPESAILACSKIRGVFLRRGFTLTPMQAPLAHKKATVGTHSITKEKHHELLKPILEELMPGVLHLITNEPKRDAASVGLADLRRRRTA